jgi:hypothetical protein
MGGCGEVAARDCPRLVGGQRLERFGQLLLGDDSHQPEPPRRDAAEAIYLDSSGH